MVTESRIEDGEYDKELERQLYREWLETEDPVARSIAVEKFVSKSKGRRYSKARGWYQRTRRNWKEVYLVKGSEGNQGVTLPCGCVYNCYDKEKVIIRVCDTHQSKHQELVDAGKHLHASDIGR